MARLLFQKSEKGVDAVISIGGRPRIHPSLDTKGDVIGRCSISGPVLSIVESSHCAAISRYSTLFDFGCLRS